MRYFLGSLALIAALLLSYKFFYQARSSGEIVVLYPDKTATKMKPVNAGGMVIPYSDKAIYENLKSKPYLGKKINILPEPEQPINIVSKTDNIDDGDSISFIINDILQASDIPPKTEDSATQKATLLDTKTIYPNNLKITNVTENSGKLKLFTSNKSKVTYKIQLAIVKTEAEAVKEVDRIKHKYPTILLNNLLTYKKIEYKNGLIVYQILLGEYENLSQAKSTCKKLLSVNQNCFITK